MSFAADYVAGPRPGEKTPRAMIVPPWYKPHADLSLPVVSSKGRPLGFTIGDVADERRWAIGPDGRCMDQADFQLKHDEFRLGQFDWDYPPQKRPPDITFAFEARPTVEGFVSRGPDPADPKRLVDLTPQVVRLPVAATRQLVVDEAISKDPRWKIAPKDDDKATALEAEVARLRALLAASAADQAPATPEPAPKQSRTYELLTCPDCGQGGLKGANGLRFHRNHKHKAA